MAQRESLWHRVQQFVRSVLVGGAATLVDMAVLELCVRGVGVAPTRAKVLALLAGVLVQFFGGRSFAFNAQRGSIRRQAALFALVEVVTLTLNWALFRVLVQRVGLPIEPATLLGGFVVYAGFSYPAWRLVFRGPTTAAEADAPAVDVVVAAPADDPDARLSAA